MKYMRTAEILITILVVSLLAATSFAAETSTISDPVDRINYSLGHQIGSDLKQQKMDVNLDALLQGVKDALSATEPQMSSGEMDAILRELKKDIVAQQRTDRQQEQQRTKEAYRGEGRDFLAQNAMKEGVITLPSGLQYKVIKEGTGKTPGPHDTVKVLYRSTLLNGVEFDSSDGEDQPAEFRVDGVIPGWAEALQLMKEGARWRLFVPADLAYGERGALADRSLIFDVELISVVAEQ